MNFIFVRLGEKNKLDVEINCEWQIDWGSESLGIIKRLKINYYPIEGSDQIFI